MFYSQCFPTLYVHNIRTGLCAALYCVHHAVCTLEELTVENSESCQDAMQYCNVKMYCLEGCALKRLAFTRPLVPISKCQIKHKCTLAIELHCITATQMDATAESIVLKTPVLSSVPAAYELCVLGQVGSVPSSSLCACETHLGGIPPPRCGDPN